MLCCFGIKNNRLRRRLRMYLVRGALYKTVSRRSGHIYFVWESWAKLPLAQDLQLPTFWPHPL